MDFSIKSADKSLNKVKTGCIVSGVYEDKSLALEADKLDTEGFVTRLIESGDISGKAGSSFAGCESIDSGCPKTAAGGIGPAPCRRKGFSASRRHFCQPPEIAERGRRGHGASFHSRFTPRFVLDDLLCAL